MCKGRGGDEGAVHVAVMVSVTVSLSQAPAPSRLRGNTRPGVVLPQLVHEPCTELEPTQYTLHGNEASDVDEQCRRTTSGRDDARHC